MVAAGLKVPRVPHPTGRHLYPGLIVARFLHNFEEVVSGFHEAIPHLAVAAEYLVLLYLALLLLLFALAPSVAHGRPWALRIARTWAIIEILNGTWHVMIALIELRYYPGLWTAPLLVIFGAALARSLRRAG